MTFNTTFRMAAAAAVLLTSSAAPAQFYGGGCSTCGTAAPRYTSVSASCCTPVYSSCYQTVPVTTYKKEKQTVRVPYYKTAYEDRDVTYYEPVTRKREIEVPTVSYQTIQENRTVHRDMGRWQTSYQPIAKQSPCQVDPRPGLLGWLNRTGYSFRSAFVPNYRSSRQYVPNVVACNVPVTRQVAVRGTRKVVVSETQMVARHKTERVEVKKLAWREETRTVSRPVTAWRTVPIGSSLAWGYGVPSATVARDDDSVRSALRAEPDPNFSERSRTSETFREDSPRTSDGEFDRNNSEDDNQFRRSSFQKELEAPIEANPLQKPPRTFPQEDPDDGAPAFEDFSTQRSRRGSVIRAGYPRMASVSTGGWKASRQSRESTGAADTGNLNNPKVSVTRR